MRFRSVGIAVCLFFAAPAAFSQDNAKFARLDSLFDVLEAKGKAMGSLSLYQNGQPVYERAFGHMDDADGELVPADLDTRYRIGSISKTFTAVLAMQLVEEGVISLDTKVSDYFPDVPNADKITVEHLLRHRSGLFNITNSPDYPTWMSRPHTRDEMMARIEKLAVNFEPGAKFEYSNSGYILLGYLLEEASGQTYAELVEEKIAGPLDLASTYVGDSESVYPEEARSYVKIEDWQRMPATDMTVPAAAGAIVAPPFEVALFFEALFDGRLVSKASLDKMTEMVDGYGYGLIRLPMGSRFAYGHNGGIDGFSSTAGHFADDKFTIAYASNGSSILTNDVMIGVLSIWFGIPYQIPTFESVQLSDAQLESYVGEYTSAAIPLGITVTKEGGNLFAQAAGQPRFPLTPAAEGEFRFDTAGIKMIFDPAAGTMELHQGGGKFPYTKKK